MSAAVQDALDIPVDAPAEETGPTQAASREAIRVAIMRAASEHGGLVHASGVRQHLPEWVHPQLVGAVTSELIRAGYLAPQGTFRRSEQSASGNRAKRLEVRRLTKPIPRAAVVSDRRTA